MKTTETVSSRRALLVRSEEEKEEEEELRRRLVLVPAKGRRHLSKQVSMKETSREAAWERRRHQFMKRQRTFCSSSFHTVARKAKRPPTAAPAVPRSPSLTDEDLDELKGCLDLGFDFKEEEDQCLTNTLPALGLYFAVKRQFSDPRLSTQPSSTSQSSTPDSPWGSRSSIFGSPKSPQTETTPTWKICSPGDNPQDVKTRLRHWAQLVACTLKQFC